MPPDAHPSFFTHIKMGVPSVLPSNVPERICTVSDFLARRNDGRLARPATIQVRLNVRLGKFQARRAAIHDHAHAAAMRFAPGRDAEQLAKHISHVAIVAESVVVVKRACPLG